MQLFLRCRLTRSERPYATRSARLALARTGRDSAGDLTPPETTCYADLPTLEEVVDEVHASMQEIVKSLKRKRHSRPLEARGAMWLLEKVNRVIHQGQEKIKEVEQRNIMQKYFRQQFAEIEQNQKLLSQQLEKLLEKLLEGKGGGL